MPYINGILLCDVCLEGNVRRWAFDSGTNRSKIDIGYAEELGLKVRGTLNVTTSTGASTFPVYRFKLLEAEELHVQGGYLAGIDLMGSLREELNFEVGGILGLDAVGDLFTAIDFVNGSVVFSQATEFVEPGKSILHGKRMKEGWMTVSAILDGKFSGDWIIDTGASHSCLTKPFAALNGLFDLVGDDKDEKTINGVIKIKYREFESIVLGKHRVERPRIGIPSQEVAGPLLRDDIAGLLGNSLFEGQRIKIDFANTRFLIGHSPNLGLED